MVCLCGERATQRLFTAFMNSPMIKHQTVVYCVFLCFHSNVAVCYQYVDPLRLSVDVQSLSVRAKHHHILDAQPSHRFLSIRNKHLQRHMSL